MKTKSDRSAAAKKAAETRRRNTAEANLTAGQTLETAMLSPIVAGVVRVWVGDETSMWRVEKAADAAALLGRGVVARTGVERDRYREVGMIDRKSGLLLLPERLRAASVDASDVLTSAKLFRVTQERAQPATEAAHWRELHDWLRVTVPAAVERGELVVVERGGWDRRAEPFAFVMCAPSESGWMAHIEAVPPPPAGSSWPAVASRGQHGQTVSAPANRETVGAAALLLVDAIIGWARSPLDVAVTFGTSPHGPFDLRSRASEST